MRWVGHKMLEEKCYEINCWHLDNNRKINKNEIKKLCYKCINLLTKYKNSEYDKVIEALKNGKLKRYELEVFISKIDYYLLKINCEAQELGCHIIEIKNEDFIIEKMRKLLEGPHFRLFNNSRLFHILIKTKYRNIFKGSSVDLREIKNIKQLKYLKNYAEIYYLKNKVINIAINNIDTVFVDNRNLGGKNAIEKLETISEILHNIYSIKDIYYQNIFKLLRKNTPYNIINPYDVESYYIILKIIENL